MLSSRDPVAVAKAAKQLVWSGDWQRQIANNTKTKVMMSLKAKMPWAVGLVHADALTALTKEVGPGTCHWDALLLVRGPDKPELERSEANLALLGNGCQRCRTRWEAAEVVDRERPYVAGLVAAGFRPEAAANLRTPEQVADYRRRLDALNRAKLPPRAATGVIRPVARKTPDPPYYQRGRR